MKGQLKLFSERLEKDCAPTPIILGSVELPAYTLETCNKIGDILTRLGYTLSTEGQAKSNNRFIAEKGHEQYSTWVQLRSRGLHIRYGIMIPPLEHPRVGVSIQSSERRKNEALQIAKELENVITENAKEYLTLINDAKFTKEAKRRILTLQD